MITFAIPYYSGADYLVRALKSVLAQQGVAWQAVVCNDGKDDIAELVRDVGEGRVRYLVNEKNLGMAGNWNRCLEAAETDLVTLLHGDDELTASYGARMAEALGAHPRAAAAYCRYDVIGPASEPVRSMTDVVKDLIDPARRGDTVLAGEAGMRALLRANIIAAPTLCYRKSVLGTRRFPPGHKFVLDWELTTQILLDGDEIVGVHDKLFRYRRHPAQATEQLTHAGLRFREEIDFYERAADRVARRGWTSCARVARRMLFTRLHIAYRTARSAARLDLADARAGIALLRELGA